MSHLNVDINHVSADIFRLNIKVNKALKKKLLSKCKPYWEERTKSERIIEGTLLWQALFNLTLEDLFYNSYKKTENKNFKSFRSFFMFLQIFKNIF